MQGRILDTSSSIVNLDVQVVEKDRSYARCLWAGRRPLHHPAPGRNDEAREGFRVIEVVRGYAAEHIGRVVDALQHSVAVEVELLRIAVRRDVFRITQLQNSPALAVFFVRS